MYLSLQAVLMLCCTDRVTTQIAFQCDVIKQDIAVQYLAVCTFDVMPQDLLGHGSGLIDVGSL